MKPNLFFSCRLDNDLYRVMATCGVATRRYDGASEAVKAAAPGMGVLILADEYPEKTTAIEPSLFDEAARKNLRLYVEYPNALPDLTVGPVRRTSLERVIAVTDAFGDGLKPMGILAVHDCHFVPIACDRTFLVVAKVAGFDQAVYGLSDTEAWPILGEHPHGDILVATTKLSQFVTGRYAPKEAMRAIWRMVFGWLQPERIPPRLEWMPTVRPTFNRDDVLPAGAARRAVQRGLDWHTAAGVLLSDKGWQECKRRSAKTPPEVVGPLPDASWGAGDGRRGVLEGVSSRIRCDGAQPLRWWLRSDCNGESALAFALRWRLDGEARSRDVAVHLLDWTYFQSGLFENNPSQANYGLLYWTPDNRESLYQDNDIKAILSCLGTAGVLETDRWDEAVVKNILGNFRTTGIHGFRGWCLKNSQLATDGWQKYWRSETILLQPHFEAWMWAAYLWLYDKTGYEPLLAKTRHSIRLMMEAYPNQWKWTNGFQQERGRMLLPLAWLLRVDDRPEHRAWLKRIADDIEQCQDVCGAVREELGIPGRGAYHPPQSNAEYGTKESPLIHENGNPVADLLYTCNFSFLGLHEAHAATGDPQYLRMRDRLAEFLTRIQVRSEAHPELDGGWFRAFDFQKWDYWGSNADIDWGAWCIEVGWTQAWIPTVLALREMNVSLWDLSRRSRTKNHFERLRKQMLPDETRT